MSSDEPQSTESTTEWQPQHSAPVHVIAHFSDTHFLQGDRPLYGAIPTASHLVAALEQLERTGTNPEAIVFTGDLADLAEHDAYVRLRSIVEPVAARMGTTIVWVMGNHDERHRFATDLFDHPESADPGNVPPQDRVYDINGLRIVALDSTVPGYHHGDLTDAQLDWLAGELATPAANGTILALHHPPIPTSVALMQLLELQGQARLEAVVRGTDVRAILGGHLHYATYSTFAGVPVSVASATCYTLDLAAPANGLSGVDGAQSFNLIHDYGDRLVHSSVPIRRFTEVSAFPPSILDALAAMTPTERQQAFSKKIAATASD